MEKSIDEDVRRILITGYQGFIGQNLINILDKTNYKYSLLLFGRRNTEDELEDMCAQCDMVFHLAGVVRPNDSSEYNNNTVLTERLLHHLVEKKNTCPIMFASSIQVERNNPYGECKKTEEKLIIEYGRENNTQAYIYRFPNLFGKYSKPNYTSVVATFCYNTSHDLPLTVNNPAATIHFAYIDDILDDIVLEMFGSRKIVIQKIVNFEKYSVVTLGELAYYMSTLKEDKKPMIHRNDSFYENLRKVYRWFSEDYEKWGGVLAK